MRATGPVRRRMRKMQNERCKTKGETDNMKPRVVIALLAALLATASLVAANVNGFENFVLSRNDGRASAPATIAAFSSRTHTDASWDLTRFSSYKPSGATITIR